MPPTGGTLDQMGQAATRGWEYAAAEANAKGGVDGHKVELVRTTTDLQPATTVRAVRKAVTQQQAHFVSGIMSSPENGRCSSLPAMTPSRSSATARTTR